MIPAENGSRRGLHAKRVEQLHGKELVVHHGRALGSQQGRVDYRHMVHALLRKPGAFALYRYRDEMLPSAVFRLMYDQSCKHRGVGIRAHPALGGDHAGEPRGGGLAGLPSLGRRDSCATLRDEQAVCTKSRYLDGKRPSFLELN